MKSVRILRALGLRLLLVCSSLIIGFLLLEVGLRITGLQPDFFWQLDPDVGATLISGKKGWSVFRGGRQFIEINSHGYRDRERSVEKAPATFRIALLGDSFVEAFQVSQEDTFAAVLERRLNEECLAAAARFEVLNFGVGGSGTAQELETLRHRASRFKPDLVLLNFYPSNDLHDNSRELDVEPNALHYALDSNARLVRLPFSVSDHAVKRWLRAHSYAYLFVRDRIKTVGALRKVLATLSVMQDQADPETAQKTREALAGVQYLRQLPPAVERSWQLTAALIAETRAEARKASARFGTVVIPNREEIMTRGVLTHADSKRDYQQSLQRIDKICDRLGIACLQLVEVFRGHPVDELYFPLDGHWTAKGHALAARATDEWMRATGLLACHGGDQRVAIEPRAER